MRALLIGRVWSMPPRAESAAHGEEGTASVELVAVVPFLLLALVAAAQIGLPGQALWSASVAARGGPAAVAGGGGAGAGAGGRAGGRGRRGRRGGRPRRAPLLDAPRSEGR